MCSEKMLYLQQDLWLLPQLYTGSHEAKAKIAAMDD